MRVQLAASIAILGVAVGGALLLQDARSAPTRSESERTPAASPTATTPATASPATTRASTASPTDTSLGSLSPTSPTPAATESGIATSEELYFGRPFETIHIPGTYHGVPGPATLRLQVWRPTGWSTFPLPVVTEANGDFRAYVDLGAGQYRLRLVDPSTGVASREFTLLLF